MMSTGSCGARSDATDTDSESESESESPTRMISSGQATVTVTGPVPGLAATQGSELLALSLAGPVAQGMTDCVTCVVESY